MTNVIQHNHRLKYFFTSPPPWIGLPFSILLCPRDKNVILSLRVKKNIYVHDRIYLSICVIFWETPCSISAFKSWYFITNNVAVKTSTAWTLWLVTCVPPTEISLSHWSPVAQGVAQASLEPSTVQRALCSAHDHARLVRSQPGTLSMYQVDTWPLVSARVGHIYQCGICKQ